ncbi:MAG: hypothetical protein NVV60_07110 [Luteimonas sp.]|nr:hypothetical protein [Luteimonas sp.]
MRRASVLLPTILLIVAACFAPDAAAQVQRCETADGRTIYTDKECQDVGAAERIPRGQDTGRAGSHRRQCSRTLQDLTFELAMSIDAQDVNRLAGLYHWPGIGTHNGYALMERLDAIARRPLVDVRPLHDDDEPVAQPVDAPAPSRVDDARPPSSAELMRSATPWRPSTGIADRPPPEATAPVETPRPRRVPHAIQVDQTLANTGTPSRTVFGLRRHLGCWWISF